MSSIGEFTKRPVPLIAPDFEGLVDAAVSYSRTILQPPPTPMKRARSAPTSLTLDYQIPTCWQGMRLQLLKDKGSVMDRVYRLGEQWILKTPTLMFQSNPRRAKDLLSRVVIFQKKTVAKGFPAAEILNAQTVADDRCIVMQYFPQAFYPIEAADTLKTMYKDLLQKAWDLRFPADLKPDNIRVHEEKLILIDCGGEEEDDTAELTIRQAINMAAGKNDDFRTFLTPKDFPQE